MHAVLGAADASAEPLVAVLGDPRFYSRFGFVIASELKCSRPILRGALTPGTRL